MGKRLKIVGYIGVEDLDPEHVDTDNEAGLSEQGFMTLIHGDEGTHLSLKLPDLEDVETSIVDE